MGKKSRLKRERRELRELRQNNLGVVRTIPIYTVEGYEHEGPVYRFFDDASHADALAQGNVFLSSLERCRAYENPEQGDKEEARETYYVDHLANDNPQYFEQAARLGFHKGAMHPDTVFSNVSNTTRLPDAYVLCTTTEFSSGNLRETSGPFCVEIKDPRKFFIAVSQKLNAISTIYEGFMGKIEYKDRKYTGMDDAPGLLGFVKPAIPYASQKEFRFMWRMKPGVEVIPFPLECPEISAMCKRVL